MRFLVYSKLQNFKYIKAIHQKLKRIGTLINFMKIYQHQQIKF